MTGACRPTRSPPPPPKSGQMVDGPAIAADPATAAVLVVGQQIHVTRKLGRSTRRVREGARRHRAHRDGLGNRRLRLGAGGRQRRERRLTLTEPIGAIAADLERRRGSSSTRTPRRAGAMRQPTYEATTGVSFFVLHHGLPRAAHLDAAGERVLGAPGEERGAFANRLGAAPETA